VDAKSGCEDRFELSAIAHATPITNDRKSREDMPSSPADTNPIFDEGTNISDTITFKSYDAERGTLTFNLANAEHHYTLGTNDTNGTNGTLDLQLVSGTASISLTFEYDTNWKQNYPDATVSVTYNDGQPNSPTYVSPPVSPSPVPPCFSITLTVGSVQLVWDPKIKVIAPPPTPPTPPTSPTHT
jgi:hypothetical protein